jgi:hypothetical protein
MNLEINEGIQYFLTGFAISSIVLVVLTPNIVYMFLLSMARGAMHKNRFPALLIF